MAEYTVTAIEQQKNNKKRYNLYLNHEFYCGLTEESIVFYRIEVGRTFSQEKLNEILDSIETQFAFDKSLNLLARGMKTVYQMKNYLESKGFAPVVIENVITKLQKYNYIDDSAYIKTYISLNKKTKGEFRIKHELMLKGVSKDLIDEFVVFDDKQEIFENALMLAKKIVKDNFIDQKMLTKVNRHLLSRGFDFSVVNEVIGFLKQNSSICIDNEDYLE